MSQFPFSAARLTKTPLPCINSSCGRFVLTRIWSLLVIIERQAWKDSGAADDCPLVPCTTALEQEKLLGDYQINNYGLSGLTLADFPCIYIPR